MIASRNLLALLIAVSVAVTKAQTDAPCDPNAACPVTIADNDVEKVFVETYLNELQNYSPLCEIFETSMTGVDAANLYYQIRYGHGIDSGAAEQDADASATQVADAFACTFDDLTECEYGVFFGLAVARYLYLQGTITTTEDAEAAAKIYADTTIASLESNEFETNAEAISDGLYKYLTAVNLYNPDSERYIDVGVVEAQTLYDVSGTTRACCSCQGKNLANEKNYNDCFMCLF